MPLRLAASVADALARGAPVVALESAILTHGMPWPRNLQTARAVQDEVRAAGAVPATIGVRGGDPVVGLDDDDLEALARPGSGAFKAAAKDLGWVAARGSDAGTTVSATLVIAAAAGVRVFATGGIGGAHRGAEVTGDVSSDLGQLAASPVVVVSAGCKSVLDLPRTLELLETLGVPVAGWGTDEFPAFFSRRSGLALDLRVDGPGEVAAMYRRDRALGRPGGILVANPVPAADEIPAEVVAGWLDAALADAAARGVTGKAVTPFLLSALNDRSGGATLRTNVALVRNNARVAASIAASLSE